MLESLTALFEVFPNLYQNSRLKAGVVDRFFNIRTNSWNFKVGFNLLVAAQDEMIFLHSILMDCQLNDNFDSLQWKLSPLGTFSTSLPYHFINSKGVKWKMSNTLSKSCVPSKVECFVWLSLHNRLSTGKLLQRKIGHFMSPLQSSS